jgi:hypothetical protein
MSVISNLRHSILLIFAGLLVSGAYLLSNGFASWTTLVWLLAGLVGGIALLWLDETIAFPRYQVMDGERVGLVSRSTLFLLSFLPLALFILTSSGSLVGMGLILGMGFSLALEMLMLHTTPVVFRERFLQQLKREVSAQEVQLIAFGFSLFILVLAILVVL